MSVSSASIPEPTLWREPVINRSALTRARRNKIIGAIFDAQPERDDERPGRRAAARHVPHPRQTLATGRAVGRPDGPRDMGRPLGASHLFQRDDLGPHVQSRWRMANLYRPNSAR